MKSLITLFCICLVLISCNNTNNKSAENNKQDEKSHTFGLNNYAVVWSTPNVDLMRGYNETITTEFTNLWKKGKIENAYFDNVSNQENPKSFPNIAFFLKAKSKSDAIDILNDLTIFKQGIASYKIFPVGMLWQGKNVKTIAKSKNKRSFVTVWETKSKNPESEILIEQTNKIMELWNEGDIENIYFDIEGTQNENEKTDFVFFVHADSIEEVNTLCNSLPFYKYNLATFKVHEVGVFWFGKYQDNH